MLHRAIWKLTACFARLHLGLVCEIMNGKGERRFWEERSCDITVDDFERISIHAEKPFPGHFRSVPVINLEQPDM